MLTNNYAESDVSQAKFREMNLINQTDHGFETTDFGHLGNVTSSLTSNSGFRTKGGNDRLFLVSKGEFHSGICKSKQTSPKLTRRRNRKKVIFDDLFEMNGFSYRVNSVKSGLYEEMLVRTIEQFEIAGQKWKRLFVYRFDLHSYYYSADNNRVSRFRDRLCKRLQRQYGFKEVSLIWAREKEKAKAQHYHCALILDGNLIRHPSNLSRIIKDCWEDETQAHHMPVISKPYYFGPIDEIRDKAIYRLSYLAKARGKGHRAKQSKDYQCSRMKL